MSPGGSEVSQMLPKVLSEFFVLPNKSKTEKTVSVSGSDSDSDSDARKPQFDARGATLFAEVAAEAYITQVEFNE